MMLESTYTYSDPNYYYYYSKVLPTKSKCVSEPTITSGKHYYK